MHRRRQRQYNRVWRIQSNGKLKQISGALAYLTTGNSGPGSVTFSPDGQFLLVTEKGTGNIDSFHVQLNGTLAPIVVTPSAGPGLFAILFAPNGAAIASETGPAGGTDASAVSSYAIAPNGKLSVISASVPTLGAPLAGKPSLQTAATSTPQTRQPPPSPATRSALPEP